MVPHNPRNADIHSATTVLVCRGMTALTRMVAEHDPDGLTVLSPNPMVSAPRTWFPLIELCWDACFAGAAADHLTRDLPQHLRLVTPEATTLLAGALHAAALVNWPVVTLTHLLDAGAVATIVELLAGADEEEFALDVAAAAGDTAPDRHHVVQAAALAAHQLLHGETMVTPPHPMSRPVTALLADATPATIIVHDDGWALAGLVIARLRYLAQTDPIITVSEVAA